MIMFQDYLFFIHILQYVAFGIGQFTNGFLIFQILTKTEKIGSYKWLMLVFALSSEAYGYIDVLTQPLMHVKGSTYVVFMTGFLKDYPVLGKILVCIFCSSFALVISLLSTQFAFRYFILCKQSFLKYFEGYRILLIFIPSLVCTFVWFQLAFWFACCTPEKQELLREDMLTHYNESTNTVPFSAIMFYRTNKATGQKEWMGTDLVAASGCGVIVYGCFFVITYCGWNTYKTLKEHSSILSQKTLDGNRQMFKTLIAQTVLPFVMVFTPSGVVLTLPLLGIYEGPWVNIVGITVAFYPALEPIVTIVCIKEFRRFHFCKKEDDKVFERVPRNSLIT